jgi:acyl-CoA thioesterase FadM
MGSSEGVARLRCPVRLLADDLDALGHVNNAVDVRWLQEAGTAHWLALASAEAQTTRVLMDKARMRPLRFPAEMARRFFAQPA